MSYEFKINGKVVEPSEIASLQLEWEQLQELLETGSLEADSVYNEGDADATITITRVLPVKNYQNPALLSNDKKSEIIINLVRKICYEEMSSKYGWSLYKIKESLSKIGFKTLDLKWIKMGYPHKFMVMITIENEGYTIEINSNEQIKELNDAS